MAIRKQVPKIAVPPKKIRRYEEVVEYLNAHWYVNENSKTLDRIKKLDAALGHPSKKVNAIHVAGTNGKSITIGLAAKLLQEEGLKVGTFTSPHFLTYNERFSTNQAAIANKQFTAIANDVINAAESLNIDAYTFELLTMISLIYFVKNKVDVALLEVEEGGTYDATNICTALVAAVTRVTTHKTTIPAEKVSSIVDDIMGIVSKETWLVSGDQNKANLAHMQKFAEKFGANWAMPIRKLVALPYPFEQIHGRCASLAERIAQLFIEKYYNKDATITADSILSRKKTKRGRPTLEEKEKAALTPHKSLEEFWQDELNDMPGRFQLLDTEKPVVLLDTSSNVDALENLLLGIRLLQYNRPLKGLALVLGAAQDTLHNDKFLRLVRYFHKKTSGELFICPLESPTPGAKEDVSWNVEDITNALKSMKVKATGFNSFAEAFKAAKERVKDRDGMICITGSNSVLSAYWRHRNIEKF